MSYTQEALETAFDWVAPKTHEKDPIHAVVPESKLEIVQEAIIHFTATVATVRPLDGMPGWFDVTSIGYRAGPAGDH